MLEGAKKYAKKIIYWILFIVTGIALYYLLSRNQQRTERRTDRNITNIRESNKRIKDYLNTAETNATRITERLREARADNQTATDIISKLEETNEKFRKLLLEISQSAEN